MELSSVSCAGERDWRVLAPAASVPSGAIIAVEVDGDEYVLWRARSGPVCAQPRACPHLDFDLADGAVDGDELVCAGHGWSFDTDGHAFKRTEHGRVDPKDEVEILAVRERDGVIEGRSRRYRPPP